MIDKCVIGRLFQKECIVYKDGEKSLSKLNDLIFYKVFEDNTTRDIDDAAFFNSIKINYPIKHHHFGVIADKTNVEILLDRINIIISQISKMNKLHYLVDFMLFDLKRYMINYFDRIIEGYEITRFELYITVYSDKCNKMHIFYDGFGNELLDIKLNNIKREILKAVKLQKRKKEQAVCIKGEYECIIAPSFAGLVAHESLGHTFEYVSFNNDSLNNDFSFSDIGLGNGEHKVPIPIYYDDLGTKCIDVNLIDKGVVNKEQAFLFRDGAVTGNRRIGWKKHICQNRMRNTCILEGKSSVEKMIKETNYGFLLLTPGIGVALPGKTFEVEVIWGLEIINGKVTNHPLASTYVSGDVIKFITNITSVGETVGWNGGLCIRGSDEILVGMGAPFIKSKLYFDSESILLNSDKRG